jgi:hypothetical protein
MKILISYRGAPRIRGWETGALVARAFRNLYHEVHEYAKIYEHDAWVSAHNDSLSQEYDLQLFLECNDGDRQYLELKHANAKRRVAWFFDVAMNPQGYKQLVDHMEFTHVYCANLDFMSTFGTPCTYLPYGCDKELFHRPLDTPKTIDVCLVGSDRPERRALMEVLKKNGINAQLISDVFKEDYINTLAASKIVINDVAGGGSNLLSMRTFEAPAAGALLLQAMVPSIHHEFEEGVSCVTFGNETQLVSNCLYYLNNDDERKRVAKNGQYWTLNHHSYEARVNKIVVDTVYWNLLHT